ncbi:MAG: hypothetical protein HYV60_10780, partial [Planctomycetia bacterium]|nr:hypothetical protein [Planctomycetia bacterium]
RLDKNNDGQLSRDEFKAVAALHQGPRMSPGPQGFGGPGGPPSAHRGPAMRGGGPPWAHSTRANFPGPQGFQGGPPWARPGHGPSVHGKFAGPPWAHAEQQRRGPHANKERAEHGDKANQAHGSDRKPPHDGVKDHRKHAKPDKAKGNAEHGRKPEKGERSDNDHHGPRDGDRAGSQRPNEELIANDLQSTSPSESHVATLPL